MTNDTFPVRLSHLLRHCSVGAIVRGKDHLVVVPDTRFWYRGLRDGDAVEIRYVRQVRKMLGISQRLRLPPSGTVGDNGEVTGGHWIPAVRFPTWMRCPKCGLLWSRPWKDSRPDEPLVCKQGDDESCGGNLEQVPWVVVHEAGYLADVPWHDVAHRPDSTARGAHKCRPDWARPYLRLVERHDGRTVSCTRCKASNRLPTRLRFPPFARQQPWMRHPPDDLPDEPAWLLEVNDVRVHWSFTSTALVIPPESRIRKGTVVDRLYTSSSTRHTIANARNPLQLRALLRRTARKWRCSVGDIEDAMNEIDRGYPLYDSDPEPGDLFFAEFGALTKPVPDFYEDEDFVTRHHTENWKRYVSTLPAHARKVGRAVSRLIEVRRLKEIVVLRGFGRLVDDKVIPPDITGDSGWLPALALRGEGIFFTLEDTMLERWARQDGLQRRAAAIDVRCQAQPVRTMVRETEISPQFILLHTLSHLMIRQLETEAGYPAASLTERIYCSTESNPMSGILIYVAVPDEIGSLGGLVELAQPRRFIRILSAAFEAANWCSLDPVCSGHDGQGPSLLNRAACQGCALIPDPSCQYGNVLLDRTFLKGNSAEGVAPLLEYVPK